MSRKIRCGRVILMKDGKIKKLGLQEGGGSRFCEWLDDDMNFDDIRHQLINIFNLGDTEYEFSIYDFQLRPLDLGQYQSIMEYMHNNGLNCNSTILYLCNREVDDGQKSTKRIMKKKNTKKDSIKKSNLSTVEQKISTQTKSNSSTALPEYKHILKTEPDSDPQIHPSLLEYSFKSTSNDLVKYVRNLINQNSFDEILIQLFEYCCIIHGYVCSTIDLAQQNQYFRSIIQSEYLSNLDNVNNICESIETLLNLNKDKFDQNQNFSIINDLFIEFYQNLKILHNQWLHHLENKNKFDGTSSSFIHSTEDNIVTHIKIPDQETYSLFQPLLNCATDLFEIMDTKRLHTFRSMIKYFITDLESIRSTIDLHDCQSLCDAKQAVTSVKIRYTRKFNERALKSSRYQFTQPIKQVHQKTLKAICDLITSLRQYQLQADEHNQDKSSKVSSTSFSINHQQKFENNHLIPTNKRKRFGDDNNDQMDTAIYSSSNV